MTGNGSQNGPASGSNRNEMMEIARLMDSDPGEAERRLHAILDQRPGDVNAAYLLGISMRLQERYEDAIVMLQNVLQVAPDFPAAQQEMGITFYQIGILEQAKEHLKEAVRLEPRLKVAWQTLGNVLGELGDNPGAREAHQKFHDLNQQQSSALAEGISPTVQEAEEALRRGDLRRADQLCRNQLEINPNDVRALTILAEVGTNLSAYGDAQNIIEKAVELDPEYHDARRLYANILTMRNDYGPALEQLDILAEKQPGNPNTGAIRAKVLAEMSDYDGAIAIYEDLTNFFNPNVTVATEFGHTLRAVGRHDEAVEAYRRGLAIDSKRGELWYSLANLKTFTFTDAEVETLTSLLADGGLSAINESHIGFALAKARSDRQETEAAWQALEQGNRARRSFTNWDADQHHKLIEDTKAAYSPTFFEQHPESGCPRPDPIFVLGLPRSGSTLVDQILASHSLVDGTMELPDIMALTRRIGGSTGPHVPSAYPGNIGMFSSLELMQQGETYLERVEPRRGPAPFFVDKMPENFLHIGFIKATLPKAKVIDTRRHPMATCYSIWKQSFTVMRDYAYDLTEIGRYYCDYIELMDHWHEVLPGFVYQIDYEALVEDPAGETAKLLEFCQLDMEEACLAPHQTQRAVRTASSEQVRQPIYKSALEEWRLYEDKLGTLREALAPLAGRYNLD